MQLKIIQNGTNLAMIMIDDEADNASINTNMEGWWRPTKINKDIRETLNIYKKFFMDTLLRHSQISLLIPTIRWNAWRWPIPTLIQNFLQQIIWTKKIFIDEDPFNSKQLKITDNEDYLPLSTKNLDPKIPKA